MPQVLDQRKVTWQSDEEVGTCSPDYAAQNAQDADYSSQEPTIAPDCWLSRQVGRQAKAGCNPFTIQLADQKFLDATQLLPKDFAGKHLQMVNPSMHAGLCRQDVFLPHPGIGSTLSKVLIDPEAVAPGSKPSKRERESDDACNAFCV